MHAAVGGRTQQYICSTPDTKLQKEELCRMYNVQLNRLQLVAACSCVGCEQLVIEPMKAIALALR